MIRFFALFAWISLAFTPALYADESPVLIELFASQNCPACPKAHRTLKSVKAENDDVLILTWSVDYWDYLGEPDPMAIPEANSRQAAYVDRLNLRAPYTPQSIYDGAKQCPATRRNRVDENIDIRRRARADIAPTLSQIGATIIVQGAVPDAPLDILLIEYLPPSAHDTGMVNPVVSTQRLGIWNGTEMQVEANCQQSCAVLLQGQNHGEIIAALELEKPV